MANRRISDQADCIFSAKINECVKIIYQPNEYQLLRLLAVSGSFKF